MQLVELEWKYYGTEHRLWKGRGTGIWSNIVFTLCLIDRRQEEYLITANIRSITNAKCHGFDKARSMAENLINSYALSQAIQ
jgi:hypothetical protein